MLTAGRNTVEATGSNLTLKMKAGATIYEGSLVALDGGYAIPAKKATGLVVAGRAEEYVDNSNGGNGDKTVKVKRSTFLFDNDETNPVTDEHVLKDCYILDDCTVTSVSTGASKAGKVMGFEDNQVIIEIL